MLFDQRIFGCLSLRTFDGFLEIILDLGADAAVFLVDLRMQLAHNLRRIGLAVGQRIKAVLELLTDLGFDVILVAKLNIYIFKRGGIAVVGGVVDRILHGRAEIVGFVPCVAELFRTGDCQCRRTAEGHAIGAGKARDRAHGCRQAVGSERCACGTVLQSNERRRHGAERPAGTGQRRGAPFVQALCERADTGAVIHSLSQLRKFTVRLVGRSFGGLELCGQRVVFDCGLSRSFAARFHVLRFRLYLIGQIGRIRFQFLQRLRQCCDLRLRCLAGLLKRVKLRAHSRDIFAVDIRRFLQFAQRGSAGSCALLRVGQRRAGGFRLDGQLVYACRSASCGGRRAI